MKWLRDVAALAAAMLVCGACAQMPDDPRSTVNVLLENDLFGSTRDRHFTHGTQISWLSPPDRVPATVKTAAETLPVFDAGGTLRVRYSLGQNIYTPNDVSTPDPPPHTHPYAGWLYGGVGLVSESEHRLDVLDLNVGVVGPPSFAEDVQVAWHDLVGAQEPKGWDHQINTEPGVVLSFERRWRDLYRLGERTLQSPVGPLALDLTPHVGVALGNVLTYGAAGLSVRFGQGLDSDYGPPRIRPSLPGSGFFDPAGPFGWYLFAGAEGRLVARNIFLDGNTFTDSRHVDKRPIVGDVQFGAVLIFQRLRLAYTHILRSKEFETQDSEDQFGAISLSIRL